MIKSVFIKDFRGFKEANFQLPMTAHILGRNEAGKTTIGHAIAFAFTGRDLFGNRLPTHLISSGSDSLVVQVETSKASIKRTLTSKKSTTVRLTIGDISHTLTQDQLEQKLRCSSDLFLSVFNPGFFWLMTEAKKVEVLSEVLPQFDSIGFIESYIGKQLPEQIIDNLKIASRRPDTVAADVARTRLTLSRQIDGIDGQIHELSSQVNEVLEMPQPPPEQSILPVIKSIRKSWDDYRNNYALYKSALSSYEEVKRRNEGMRERRAIVEEELKKIKPDDSFSLRISGIDQRLNNIHSEMQAIRQSMERVDTNVTLVKEVNSEVCPTCGQVVGLKHRERVREENNKRLLEFDREKKLIEERNAKRSEELSGLEKQKKECEDERSKIVSYANTVHRRTAELEGELTYLKDLPLPAVPTPPEPPSENEFDPQEEQRVRSVVEHFGRKLVEFEFTKKKIDAAAEKINLLREEQGPLVAKRDFYSLLEEALKELPAAKRRKQAEDLRMDGYVLEAEESGVSLRREDGMPHQLLSTGASVKANIAFSLKLNSMMKVPINMMLIDNAELCDDIRIPESGLQILMAYVSKNHNTVEIRDIGGRH